MKKSITILAVLVVVFAAFLFTSCPEVVDAMSKKDCIEGFVDDANEGNWDDLKQYMHPDSPYYEQSNAANMQNWLEVYTPLEVGNVGTDVATATGAGGENFIFTLQEDSSDDDSYKIYSVLVDNVPISLSVK